jgi:hypothetical protein
LRDHDDDSKKDGMKMKWDWLPGATLPRWLLNGGFGRNRWFQCLSGLLFVLFAQLAPAIDDGIALPKPGDHSLRILSPILLELVLINTKQPNQSSVDSWNWITEQGNFAPPDLSKLSVRVNGQVIDVTAVGFKRRPVYASLIYWDLRIANALYLQVNPPVTDGQSVEVINDGTLWPTNLQFAAAADPLRYNPALHVNQEGYLPSFPKKAMVGYYLGSLGEMPMLTNTYFLVNAQTGAAVYQGTLTQRPDVGYTYTPTPYQEVHEADFSSFTTPGEYRLMVPGMGASLPFRIDEGTAMFFARTYALGLFHQRSGFDVAMPFTRFTHAPDHLTPALVPTNTAPPFEFNWNLIASHGSQGNSENPPQIAPPLTNPAAQLFPFVKQGAVDVSGGHFEAGDYNKVTYNSAQLIHVLMFAVDSLSGVAALDNLGIPESGDGISDVLQEAKWEADFLAKMQDADGGFYYSSYPQDREYEANVLPEHGDPSVLWPKNTAVTAAAVAALAQCASSPRFKQAYPQVADQYWEKAQLGWTFLTNAIAVHGLGGAYQKLQHFGDHFADRDELAWAACEMYLATGDPQFRTALEAWFPDPTDPGTTRWGWWRMFVSYGNAIRSYAAAVPSGRLEAAQLDAGYLAGCINVITNCGNDNLRWSQDNAYGSSFPDATKRVRGAGWYFSSEQAFDLVVAHQFNPNPAYVEAVIANLNYEAGCNPINMSYVTGLGWKRQREIVDQYSNNDRRVLPKTGIPISNLQEGFVWTFMYGWDLSPLCFPSDGAATAPYPIYDRWCDMFNVSTESSTTTTVRSMAVAAWLAAQTSAAGQPWTWTNATILAPPAYQLLNQPITVTLQVADTNLTGARIIWEGRDQEATFGGLSHTFALGAQNGDYWIEAEVQWPDGRRAFAMNSVSVNADAAPRLSDPQHLESGEFSFRLAGVPEISYVIEGSTDLLVWQPVATNALPAAGEMWISDPQAPGHSLRYYRARKAP